ncbi:MAG: zinc-finger domain-containing protein [Stellaceae bacterium]
MGIIGRSAWRARVTASNEKTSSAMGPSETIYIDQMVAACNGGGGPLGHPRVYLNLAPAGRVECPYCSRLYVNRAMAAAAGGGTGPDPSSTVGPPTG